MNDYDYKYVKISDLYLDDENPRFASSVLVNNSSNIVTQQAIIEHLVKHRIRDEAMLRPLVEPPRSGSGNDAGQLLLVFR